jgi:hypothetical protein
MAEPERHDAIIAHPTMSEGLNVLLSSTFTELMT